MNNCNKGASRTLKKIRDYGKNEGIAEGKAEGIEEGISKGEKTNKESTVKRMLSFGIFTDEQIAMSNDVSADYVKALKQSQSLMN